MSGVDWSRCHQRSRDYGVDVTRYYDGDQARGEWRERLVKRIDGGLAELERQVKVEGTFRRGDYSVYSGISGVALLYLHVADTLYYDQPRQRDAYLARAIQLLEQPLKRLNGRRLTFLCGDAGVLALAAVLYHRASSHTSTVTKHCANGLLTLADLVFSDRTLSSELMYGMAGYLHAVLFLRKYLPELVDGALVTRLVGYLLATGKEGAREAGSTATPLFYTWHDKAYLGAAHGLAGILLTLLQTEILTQEQMKLVSQSTNYLLSMRFTSGNLMSSVGSQNDRLVQWCHGSPGMIPLLTQLNRVEGGKRLLPEAIKSSGAIWKRGLLTKGHGLCHGTLGNAYAFLDLYQATGDTSWLAKAIDFTEWSMSDVEVKKEYKTEMSLFDGLAGVLYFYCDMLNPKSASFPGFQL